MNDLFNIIKNSLRSNAFLIPSQNTYVNGSSLTIKQYNDLLELDASVDFGFEQYLKYSVLSDNIIKENIESVDNLIYFDKIFILAQIKMSQESDFLGVSLEEYQQQIKNNIQTLNLSSYSAEYNNNNLSLSFGLNSFKEVQKINSDYLEYLNKDFNSGNVITLEVLKYIKTISYMNQPLTEIRDVKQLAPLVQEFPAVLIEPFNSMLQTLTFDIKRISTFKIKGDNFTFNPTLEFMLS